jgi:hypothetical protein
MINVNSTFNAKFYGLKHFLNATVGHFLETYFRDHVEGDQEGLDWAMKHLWPAYQRHTSTSHAVKYLNLQILSGLVDVKQRLPTTHPAKPFILIC